MSTINKDKIRILAIPGSTRQSSANLNLIKAIIHLFPEQLDVEIFDGIAGLPHFNPDLDTEDAPPSVVDLRKRLQATDGVFISSPEYAHGVPGVLKNGLDWLVSSGEFVGKPVALINTSPRATHAQASLAETLSVMTANLVSETPFIVPLLGKKIDEASLFADAEISETLYRAILALIGSINEKQTERVDS